MPREAESAARIRAQWYAIGTLVASLACAGLLVLFSPRLASPEMRWIPTGVLLAGVAVSQFIVGAQPLKLRDALNGSVLGSAVVCSIVVNTQVGSSVSFHLSSAAISVGALLAGFLMGRAVLALRRTRRPTRRHTPNPPAGFGRR